MNHASLCCPCDGVVCLPACRVSTLLCAHMQRGGRAVAGVLHPPLLICHCSDLHRTARVSALLVHVAVSARTRRNLGLFFSRFKDELKDEPTGGKYSPSSEKKRELQPSLHSHKEQKRRLQIRTSCRRLCGLLPFVNCQLDTATTLELTARYMSYLKETLPPDVLSKVNKAVEEKVSGLWKNIQRPQKKRYKLS
ncbi:uncharacterized protein AKAME5_000623600 [Lates japonicus]|uniref:BHLH domain-containing protein n=1 Tax=Lates japonicus TaxID=270547 RepID=A0AAD3R177_LATJO|nr:uncharacterized protein AKAME5_000623600 [Lates japonicus]